MQAMHVYVRCFSTQNAAMYLLDHACFYVFLNAFRSGVYRTTYARPREVSSRDKHTTPSKYAMATDIQLPFDYRAK